MNIDKRFYNKALGDKNKNPLTFLPAIQPIKSQETHTNLAEDFATIEYVNDSISEFSPLYEGVTDVQNTYFEGQTIQGIRVVEGERESVIGTSINTGAPRVELSSYNDSSKDQLYSRLVLDGDNVSLQSFNGLDEISISIDPQASSFIVGGFSTFKGIEYDDDYLNEFTNRSLVDKAYVDRKLGWAVYGDSQYTDVSPLSIGVGVTTTVDIDGLGNTITTYLPSDTTDFYDTVTSKITPTNVGDGYTFTLSFKGSSSSNNGSATIGVDIGGAVGEIFRRSFRFPRGIGETHEFYMTSQGYSLDTFVANGGIIKITSDVGTSEIWDIALQVHRTYRAES